MKIAFTVQGKGIKSVAYMKNNTTFVVSKGSAMSANESPKMAGHKRTYYQIRRLLIDNGTVKLVGAHYVFTRNYSFSSISALSSVVLGNSRAGDVAKFADGSSVAEYLKKGEKIPKSFKTAEQAAKEIQRRAKSRSKDHTYVRRAKEIFQNVRDENGNFLPWFKKKWDEAIWALPGKLYEAKGAFSKSPDQIIAGNGYTEENVRIVPLIYNLAKNKWSDEAVKELAAGILKGPSWL